MADGLSIRLKQSAPVPLDVVIDLELGQTLALVGPSGAGKTTVLRTIAGFHRPSEARIACGGEIWLDTQGGIDRKARDRRVGMVFQSYALFPHLSAADNIAEAMLDEPPERRRHRTAELLEQVHLGDLGARLPGQLSGGQQQRVALARALARNPKILLLDEPFSAVDQPTRRSLHRLLAEIRASTQMPIVIVSHDVEDAARSADCICFMDQGTTLECDVTAAVLGNPASRLAQWLAQEYP